jgi:hypothetical protein
MEAWMEIAATQLPFKSLALAPGESIIGGIEVRTIQQFNPTVLLVVTDRNIHCVPLPRVKLGFEGMAGDDCRSLPLSAITGAAKSRITGFSLKSAKFFPVNWLLPDALRPELISLFNIALGLSEGKELVEAGKDKWEIQRIALSEDSRQHLLSRSAALQQQLFEKYTTPEAVEQLRSRQARTGVVNVVMVVLALIVVLVLTLRQCS